MTTTIEEFLALQSKVNEMLKDDSDDPGTQVSDVRALLTGLAFHGVEVDKMEVSSTSEEMQRNFLEHIITGLLRREWGIPFTGTFKEICRYEYLKRICLISIFYFVSLKI